MIALAVPFISSAFIDDNGCTMTISPQNVPINSFQNVTLTVTKGTFTGTLTEGVQIARNITQFHLISGSAVCATYMFAH